MNNISLASIPNSKYFRDEFNNAKAIKRELRERNSTCTPLEIHHLTMLAIGGKKVEKLKKQICNRIEILGGETEIKGYTYSLDKEKDYLYQFLGFLENERI